jgi:hypothetical protein
MHLGLIDRPFMSHNLILAQESLVPVPKFQMFPKLKILMSSVSKKGTLKKSWQANTLQVSQRGPYGDRYPLTGNFYISLGTYLYLKGPKRRVPSCSLKAGPLWKQTPIPKPY